MTQKKRKGLPHWLRKHIPRGCAPTKAIVHGQQVNTVCQEAKCPNRMECWSKRTATFLIMGKECTRNCGFCDIAYNLTPSPLDPEEPKRVARAVRKLKLKHVVITMVTRDDLADGGARHLVETIFEVREKSPEASLEVLTSDFDGNFDALEMVLGSSPEVFNHNIETVYELSAKVRHKASYERSLTVLEYLSQNRKPKMLIKSGIMVGLGETEDQVKKTLKDLYKAGCDIVTIGQYLQPCKKKIPVKDFIEPKQFDSYREYGLSLGIHQVVAAPFVRSSYQALESIFIDR